jgi:hypothetical protein
MRLESTAQPRPLPTRMPAHDTRAPELGGRVHRARARVLHPAVALLEPALGKYRAIALTFATTADARGAIAIQFITRKDNAKVDGIEIL